MGRRRRIPRPEARRRWPTVCAQRYPQRAQPLVDGIRQRRAAGMLDAPCARRRGGALHYRDVARWLPETEPFSFHQNETRVRLGELCRRPRPGARASARGNLWLASRRVGSAFISSFDAGASRARCDPWDAFCWSFRWRGAVPLARSAPGSSNPEPATSSRCSSCPTRRDRGSRSARAVRAPAPSR